MSLKHLTKDLTSYDLLKSFAVVFMLVDHIGYYFFEDDNWWRVAGRMCVPVWFFLIGYARSRDMGAKMWIGMIILAIGSAIVGIGVFPINILGTMLIVRLFIDPIMVRSTMNSQALWQFSVLLLLLSFPSSYLFEYGTLAIIMAMFGWLVRNQHEYPDGEKQSQRFFFFAYSTFIIIQIMFFAFQDNEMLVFAGGILAVMCVLMFFKPITFIGTGEGAKAVLLAPFRFMGRWTLEIYVVHLLILKALGVIIFPERFQLFNWQWIPEGMMSLPTSGIN